MPEQQEWWRDYTQLLHFADGSTEVNIHEKDIPAILAEHRKMVVKEIRKKILRVWEKPLDDEDSYGFAVAGKALVLNEVLSLPELKEE